MSWELLIDDTELERLLPPAYAHFARPVREGLVVFLSGLPEEKQRQLLAEQAALFTTATLSVRLGVLARRCPVLHKLGQVLARDQRLAEELREQLRPLESLPPSVNLPAIERRLTDELGSLESRGVTLLPPAIAEASVAVVIPFRRQGDPAGEEGVFKILKPGIEERMQWELDLLAEVGVHLDSRCEELGIPHLDYRETFDLVRDKLGVEVRLDREQQHLAEATLLYADERSVLIPRLLELCTPRVTAMQRVYGEKVTDHALDSHVDRKRIARLITRAILVQPMFARAQRSMFHSDPHAGNLMLTRDRRLAILDWSLVGHLGERERVMIGQILLAAFCLRRERLIQLLIQLDERGSVDVSALKTAVDASLHRILRGQLPGLTWLVDLLDAAAQEARLRMNADMILFRKALHTLEGVIHEMHAEGFRIENELMFEFALQFGLEWAERSFAPPDSRQFATRISNADLASCMLQIPMAAARYMHGELSDARK